MSALGGFGRSGGRARPDPLGQRSWNKGKKPAALSSSATDDDFYSSLAQMAGTELEEEEDSSLSETDARQMADSLAGMDDLDSDLFGSSLRSNKTPSKATSPKPTAPATRPTSTSPKPTTASTKPTSPPSQAARTRNTAEKPEEKPASFGAASPRPASKPGQPGKKFNINKFNSLDFDEDDPLAGLLSDDEDAPVKPKPKKAAQKKAVRPDPEPVKQEMEPAKPDPLPKQTGAKSAAKPKEDINFDSDGDLPGLDGTPRESASPPPKGRGRQAKPEPDLFGDDDDGLLGLDEDKPGVKRAAAAEVKDSPSDRFSALLGGKKEEQKKAPPQSLDEFMANISTKRPDAKPPAAKKATSPTSEESFQFGGYMPSAASTPGRARTGISRPDTAPGSGRRSVRFADDLGLDDDILGSSRPRTAPSNRGRAVSSRGADEPETERGGSFLDEVASPRRDTASPEGKPGGGAGADWLGLGTEDPGLELPLSLPKRTPEQAKPVSQSKPTKPVSPAATEPTSGGSKSPDETPTRIRRRSSKESDDFLKMLGITPDETDKPQAAQGSRLPWETSGRRGRRWQEQSSTEGDSLDSSSTQHPKQTAATQQKIPNMDKPTYQPDTPHSTLATATPASQTNETRSPWKQDTLATDTPSSNTLTTRIQPGNQALMNQQPQGSQTRHNDQPPVHTQALPAGQPQATQQQEQIQSAPETPAPQGAHQVLSPGPSIHLPGTSAIPQGNQQTQPHDPRFNLAPGAMVTQGHFSPGYYPVQSTPAPAPQATQLQSFSNVSTGFAPQGVQSDYGQLQNKLHHLQMERDHLQATLESLKQRHQSELESIQTSHKAHVKTIEESYERREARIKEESDLQINYYTERLRSMEQELADNQSAHARKLQLLESQWTGESERLRDLHRKSLEDARTEHAQEIAHLKRLKDEEVAVATSAHAHTRSLQSLMERVMSSTRDVSDMRQQLETTHKSGMEERETVARARDEYLAQLHDRLVRQQAETEEERTRLQGLIAKMELHLREQTRQLDQEKWRLSAEEARVKTLQNSLETERRMTMEQLAEERADVQRLREEFMREQQRVTLHLQEEKRALSTERAQLASTHRELMTRERHKTDTSIQAEADLEATATAVKQDAAALSVRQAQMKQQEESLARDKREFERRKESFEEEKDRIGKLSLEVQQRSQEIGELCAEATRVREEGEEALVLAERLRAENGNEQAELDNQLVILQEKERQLAEDRVAIAHERRLLEMDKRAGRCRECAERHSPPLPRTADSPVIPAEALYSPQSPGRGRTPDILLNSLELKRALRRWSSDKEKDEEFLAQESRFLNRLQTSRDSARSRQSLVTTPTQ
ncbi:fas-binding factor 1 homolog isoform X2 [Nematostella vectensis]|uniref:fas-binding factor 1 homolog isoform X2 n=1 Tax=Nematostella vectensis TaxID=45351 RepID=UPI002076F900|nr:fas-binding factor 1 homolog isoform X2 [Nematostella vectensis]